MFSNHHFSLVNAYMMIQLTLNSEVASSEIITLLKEIRFLRFTRSHVWWVRNLTYLFNETGYLSEVGHSVIILKVESMDALCYLLKGETSNSVSMQTLLD